LTPEIFHLYWETNSFGWTCEIDDFFKAFSYLQKRCSSAAFWTGYQLQVHRYLRELRSFGFNDLRIERSSTLLATIRPSQRFLYLANHFVVMVRNFDIVAKLRSNELVPSGRVPLRQQRAEGHGRRLPRRTDQSGEAKGRSARSTRDPAAPVQVLIQELQRLVADRLQLPQRHRADDLIDHGGRPMTNKDMAKAIAEEKA
jgi:hypothetical protein